MIFYKTSSFGNDFIEIDAGELPAANPRRPQGASRDPQGELPLGGLAREICDRQRGVGADGVVYYSLGKRKTEFQIFNRDGGEAELSGNGMAGLAAVLFQRRLAVSPLVLHAASGSRRVGLLGRAGPLFELNVEIGKPDFFQRGFFPFLGETQETYRCAGVEFHPVSVGNPHAVVVCRKLPAAAQSAALGKKLESHPMFPRRVNVEFVEYTGAESCRVFFFERGVGPTQASSTGSAAVFAVLRRLNKIHDHLDIELDTASTAEGPAGKEFGSHGTGYPAGAGAEKIQVSWSNGIYIRNFTRLICRGEYFY